MISHTPNGIDDPYRPHPTERLPRDPRPGDRVQVNFLADGEVLAASVRLTSGSGEIEVPALSLGGGLWTATLPALEYGDYEYAITVSRDAGPESTTAFPLSVGRWIQAEGVQEVTSDGSSVTLHLHVPDRDAPAAVTLTFPVPGVCRADFSTASPVSGSGLPCTLSRQGGILRLSAERVEVAIDAATLQWKVWQPSREDAGFDGSLAVRWLENVGGECTLLEAGFAMGEGESFYGLGERFRAADRAGSRLDVRVYEEYKEQGDRTYLPVPFLVSEKGYGLWLDAEEPSLFDLRGGQGLISLPKLPDRRAGLALNAIVAERPYGVTAAFTRLTGDIAVPPKWAFGPWMSSNDWNSQAKTEAVLRRTLAEDVPATVLVLEAWSDESTFYIFNDAEYQAKAGSEPFALSDFRFAGRWPDPKAMVDECHEHGIRVVLWQIPVQKRLSEHHPQNAADEAYMIAEGYGIREADGSPYRCKGWWFPEGLVIDFSHPQAREWWFAKRRYLLDEIGIDGMKTDGGEHLFGRDLRAYDGRRGLQLFNAYPNQYVGAYHDFVRAGTKGDGLTFSRSGYTGAQRYPGHWAGDENSTWNAYKSSIQAGLSAGISGISMWSWDIGGFSGDIPTAELYVRSTAFACFCPLMQYHSEYNAAVENRDRSPWNISERTGDARALEIYRRYAKLRMRLLDYLHGEAVANSASGLPLMRYPHLEFPEAAEVLRADAEAYLFGRDLLVCPVTEKGATAREVRLPPGDWVDFWSGARLEGGKAVLVPAPLERIPVFVRADSPRLNLLLEAALGF
jgi:alpha-D-xyloside xylohydrolase